MKLHGGGVPFGGDGEDEGGEGEDDDAEEGGELVAKGCGAPERWRCLAGRFKLR